MIDDKTPYGSLHRPTRGFSQAPKITIGDIEEEYDQVEQHSDPNQPT